MKSPNNKTTRIREDEISSISISVGRGRHKVTCLVRLTKVLLTSLF